MRFPVDLKVTKVKKIGQNVNEMKRDLYKNALFQYTVMVIVMAIFVD